MAISKGMSLTYVIAILFVAACSSGSSSVAGSYNGTLTVTTTSDSLVVSGITNINLDSGAELFSTGSAPMPDVNCGLGAISTHGSTINLDCSTVTCICTISSTLATMSLEVTAAAGTEANDLLTLTFSGTEDPGNVAFTAMFMGTLEPGTR